MGKLHDVLKSFAVECDMIIDYIGAIRNQYYWEETAWSETFFVLTLRATVPCSATRWLSIRLAWIHILALIPLLNYLLRIAELFVQLLVKSREERAGVRFNNSTGFFAASSVVFSPILHMCIIRYHYTRSFQQFSNPNAHALDTSFSSYVHIPSSFSFQPIVVVKFIIFLYFYLLFLSSI